MGRESRNSKRTKYIGQRSRRNTMDIQLQYLTAEAFAPFGQIIGLDEQNSKTFQVVLKEEDMKGWQIAVSNLTPRRSIVSMGLHPNTRESFEPLTGIGIIVVATEHSPDEPQAFLLDKPVCLYKNIWHATMALSERATVKVVENALDIEGRTHRYEQPLSIRL
jgi:ureidoglycolate hydrolase